MASIVGREVVMSLNEILTVHTMSFWENVITVVIIWCEWGVISQKIGLDRHISEYQIRAVRVESRQLAGFRDARQAINSFDSVAVVSHVELAECIMEVTFSGIRVVMDMEILLIVLDILFAEISRHCLIVQCCILNLS